GCGSSSLLVFSPLFPVSECNEFFLNKQPPWVPGILENGKILNQDRYKVICQTFKNEKIPLFSAYKYRGNGDKREREGWYTEPKLEGNGMWDGTYRNQADLEDYINSTIYNKGHLFPFSHGFSEDDKLSTNTLTNIVPQVKTFNGGSWANMETCTKCVLDQLCLNNKGTSEGSVVVKANQLNDRVNIPDRLWSAFCCYRIKLSSFHHGGGVLPRTQGFVQLPTAKNSPTSH
uniref:DNA/RNA non-specific endonuclease domain-containing protein n=1 Tax=Gouania willdenowi TaxID=441366 RepID=A0A8C5GC50_GOUWI